MPKPYPTHCRPSTLAGIDVPPGTFVDGADLDGVLSIPGVVGDAIRAAVWSLSLGPVATRAQETAQGVYVECCASYVQRIAECGYRSALTAWSALRDLFQWSTLSTSEASALVTLRRLRAGERYGRHLVLTSEAWHRLRSLGHRLEELGLSPKTLTAQAETSSPARLPRGERTGVARCPSQEHARGDVRPSLVLWPARDSHGGRGACVCMACGARGSWREGAPAEALITLSGGSSYDARPMEVVEQSTQVEPIERPHHPEGRPEELQQPDHRTPSHAQAVIRYAGEDGRWRRWRSAGSIPSTGDQIDALIRAEQRSKGPVAREQAQVMAQCVGPGLSPDVALPVPVVTLDEVKPERWVETWTGWRPVGWTSTQRRWLVLDLDDIQGLERVDPIEVAEELLREVSKVQGVDGARGAVVQTSPTGLHVWVSLSFPLAPGSAELRWIWRVASRRVLSTLGGLGVTAVSDPTATQAGRWARRPGWRILPSGEAYRARLLVVRT